MRTLCLAVSTSFVLVAAGCQPEELVGPPTSSVRDFLNPYDPYYESPSNTHYGATFLQTGGAGGAGGTADVAYIRELARGAHIGWIRTEINWNEMQPDYPYQPLDSTRKAWYTALFDGLTADGVKIYAVLNRSPNFARTGSTYGRDPACIGDGGATCIPDEDKFSYYQAYLDTVLTAFPQVSAWGVWNEPNSFGFLPYGDQFEPASTTTVEHRNETGGRMDRYERIAWYTADKVRSHYPSSNPRLLVGLELGTDSEDGYSAHTWFTHFVSTTAWKFDVLSVHKYADAATTLADMDWYASNSPLPVWLTEFGFDSLVTGGVRASIAEEDAQREHLLTVIFQGLNARPTSAWQKAFFFNMYNNDNIPGNGDGYDLYALVRDVRTTTPVVSPGYYCLQHLAVGVSVPSGCSP